MKLKNVRYFGRFYEFEGQLGWMPWYKALITMIVAPNMVKWISQKNVNFGA